MILNCEFHQCRGVYSRPLVPPHQNNKFLLEKPRVSSSRCQSPIHHCKNYVVFSIDTRIRGILIFNQDLWGIEKKREYLYWCFAEFFCKVRKVYRRIFLLKFYLMVRLVFFSSSRLLGCPQGLIPSMPPSNCNSILLLNSSSFSGVFCFY